MLPATLPALKGGAQRHPAGAGGGHLRHLDRLLVTLCLLASVTLLYRCLAFTGGLPLLGVGGGASSTSSSRGGATVISTTVHHQGLGGGARGGSSRGGNVVTELVIDSNGRTRSTTVTDEAEGLSITVLGSGSGGSRSGGGGGGDASLRSRRASLRQAAVQRQAVAAAAALAAGDPGHHQQGGQQQRKAEDAGAYPGLPRDFDTQVRRRVAACCCRATKGLLLWAGCLLAPSVALRSACPPSPKRSHRPAAHPPMRCLRALPASPSLACCCLPTLPSPPSLSASLPPPCLSACRPTSCITPTSLSWASPPPTPPSSTTCSRGGGRGAPTSAFACFCGTPPVQGSSTSSTATSQPSPWRRRWVRSWCCRPQSAETPLRTTSGVCWRRGWGWGWGRGGRAGMQLGMGRLQCPVLSAPLHIAAATAARLPLAAVYPPPTPLHPGCLPRSPPPHSTQCLQREE